MTKAELNAARVAQKASNERLEWIGCGCLGTTAVLTTLCVLSLIVVKSCQNDAVRVGKQPAFLEEKGGGRQNGN